MTKLKTLPLAALAAATVAAGALVATPTASAQKNFYAGLCERIGHEYVTASDWADKSTEVFGSNSFWSNYWNERAVTYGRIFKAMGC
jgi:hypothetical protein